MKCLSIQLQPERDDFHDENEAISLLRSINRYPEVDVGDDDGKYVNLNFFSEDVSALWKDIYSKLLNDELLGQWVKNVSIIVCEGETGWDDYLLLYHFDSNQKLDEL